MELRRDALIRPIGCNSGSIRVGVKFMGLVSIERRESNSGYYGFVSIIEFSNDKNNTVGFYVLTICNPYTRCRRIVHLFLVRSERDVSGRLTGRAFQ